MIALIGNVMYLRYNALLIPTFLGYKEVINVLSTKSVRNKVRRIGYD